MARSLLTMLAYHLYRGLIRCDHCGSAISPERKKGGKYVYYKCTEYHGKHGAKYISEANITKQLLEVFKEIQVPTKRVNQIVQTLKESHDDKTRYSTTLMAEYRKEYDKYANRKRKVYFDKLDGLITVEEYHSITNDCKDQQKALEAKMSAIGDADDSYYQSAETLLNLANKATELFENSEAELKKLFIKLTLQNLKLKGTNLVYDWNSPFKCVAVSANCLQWHARQDSNL